MEVPCWLDGGAMLAGEVSCWKVPCFRSKCHAGGEGAMLPVGRCHVISVVRGHPAFVVSEKGGQKHQRALCGDPRYS